MSGVQCLKREGCIVMLAFLGGIVLTNLLWRKSADTWTTAESDISATVCLSKSGWESAVWSCGYGAHADAGSHLFAWKSG